MKRLFLILPFLALATMVRAEDPATNVAVAFAVENAIIDEPLEIHVTPSPDALAPTFEVETWLFEMLSDDLRKLQQEGIFADEPVPVHSCWLRDKPPIPVRGAEDGIRPGLDIFTEPQRQVLFPAISNRCGSAVIRHAPPMVVRSSDRLDVSASGCVFSVSPVLSRDRARFDLFLAVDLKPGSPDGSLLPFGKEPNASAFPSSSVCVLLPSRETDGRARIVVWKATMSAPATNAPAASEAHAENAENAEN